MAPDTSLPFLDLRPQIREQRTELLAALSRVVDSGCFIGGPEVTGFEAEAAAFLGVRHAVGVNSGTDALVLALRALGVGPGDEVVTSPFTFFATAEAVSIVGARPVFADIEADSFNLDPGRVAEVVTSRTRALLPVHLFGRPAAMGPLLELAADLGLAVLEDCAQAFGARCGEKRVGSLGRAGAFSFFPSKNLGGFGDGGLVTTDDPEVAERVRMLRNHGSRKRYWNEAIGMNSRLDALQAAVLRIRLPRVDAWNQGRRRAAAVYHDLLAGLEEVGLPELAAEHVFHQFTIRVAGGRERRDAVVAALGEAGVPAMLYYPTPLHRLPPYAGLNHGPLPEAERAAEQVLSLPIWPDMPRGVQERVAAALRSALARTGRGA